MLINDYEHFCLLTAYLNTPAVCVHVNTNTQTYNNQAVTHVTCALALINVV